MDRKFCLGTISYLLYIIISFNISCYLVTIFLIVHQYHSNIQVSNDAYQYIIYLSKASVNRFSKTCHDIYKYVGYEGYHMSKMTLPLSMCTVRCLVLQLQQLSSTNLNFIQRLFASSTNVGNWHLIYSRWGSEMPIWFKRRTKKGLYWWFLSRITSNVCPMTLPQRTCPLTLPEINWSLFLDLKALSMANTRDPFYNHRLTLIPIWTSNHRPSILLSTLTSVTKDLP